MRQFKQIIDQKRRLTYSTSILLIVSTASMTSYGGRFLLAPLLPAIIDSLDITATLAGIAVSVLVVCSAVGRYPGGRLSDHFSRQSIVVLAIIAMGIGFSFIAIATNYWILIIGAIVAGTALGFYTPSAYAFLSDIAGDRTGRALSINNAGNNLGGILGTGVAALVLTVGIWQLAYVPVVCLLALLAIVLHYTNTDSYHVQWVTMDVRQTVRRIISIRPIRLTLIASILFTFAYQGVLTFLPLFLQVDRDISVWLANAAYASVFVVGIVANLLVGSIGDRIGHLWVMGVTSIIVVVGITIMLVGTSPIIIVGGVLITAAGFTSFWPIMNAFVLTRLPADSKAGDFGALGVFYIGFGSLGPTFVGFVAERGSYGFAFGWMAIIVLITIGILAWLGIVARQ